MTKLLSPWLDAISQPASLPSGDSASPSTSATRFLPSTLATSWPSAEPSGRESNCQIPALSSPMNSLLVRESTTHPSGWLGTLRLRTVFPETALPS